MANGTLTKAIHKPHAAQRLGFSRARHTGTDVLDRERVLATSRCQNRGDRARRLQAGVGQQHGRVTFADQYKANDSPNPESRDRRLFVSIDPVAIDQELIPLVVLPSLRFEYHQ